MLVMEFDDTVITIDKNEASITTRPFTRGAEYVDGLYDGFEMTVLALHLFGIDLATDDMQRAIRMAFYAVRQFV